jgi:hypothetical protein
MKKGLLLFALIAFVGTLAFSQGKTATFNWIDDAPTLDGKADDAVWSNDAVTTLMPDVNFGSETPTLTDATIKAFWNDTAIFVFCSATDDLWQPSWVTGKADWESDKLELYFDVNSTLVDGGGAGGGNGHHQVAPNFNETAVGSITGGGGRFQADDYDGDGYYAHEYSVSFASLTDSEGIALDPYVTTVIGFDVTFIDNDDGTTRNRLDWANAGGTDENWNNMDDAGVVTFNATSVQMKVADKLSVYPTIASDYINIPQGVSSVEVFNTIGQRVMGVENPGQQVSVAELETGFHFVKVRKDGEYGITKIIIK